MPESAKTIRKFPSNPLENLKPVPLDPPPFQDGKRVTRQRLDALSLNQNGFLNLKEVQIFEHILLQNEKAIAFDESEKGQFRDDYFSPHIFPTIDHVPWTESAVPIPKD